MTLARAIIAALAMALFATQAFAHAELVSTTPADKAVVSSTKAVTLKFSEGLNLKLSGATVTSTQMMMSGKMTNMVMKVPNITAALDPKDPATLVLTAKTPLAVGTYKVDWHAVADDTHRSTGSFTFSVK